jgi:hypothetical protein
VGVTFFSKKPHPIFLIARSMNIICMLVDLGIRSKFWTNFHREGVIGSIQFLHQVQNLFPQLQDLPVNHGFSPPDQTKT